jgi:hypothetical protein
LTGIVTRTLQRRRPARVFQATAARITAAMMLSLSEAPSAEAAARRRSVDAWSKSSHWYGGERGSLVVSAAGEPPGESPLGGTHARGVGQKLANDHASRTVSRPPSVEGDAGPPSAAGLSRAARGGENPLGTSPA